MDKLSLIIENLKRRVKYDKISCVCVPYFWGDKITILYRDFYFSYLLSEEIKRTRSIEVIVDSIVSEYVNNILSYYLNE